MLISPESLVALRQKTLNKDLPKGWEVIPSVSDELNILMVNHEGRTTITMFSSGNTMVMRTEANRKRSVMIKFDERGEIIPDRFSPENLSESPRILLSAEQAAIILLEIANS